MFFERDLVEAALAMKNIRTIWADPEFLLATDGYMLIHILPTQPIENAPQTGDPERCHPSPGLLQDLLKAATKDSVVRIGTKADRTLTAAQTKRGWVQMDEAAQNGEDPTFYLELLQRPKQQPVTFSRRCLEALLKAIKKTGEETITFYLPSDPDSDPILFATDRFTGVLGPCPTPDNRKGGADEKA